MNYIFLDTETTGNGEEDRLVQLAWYCEKTGFRKGLFKPPLPIKYGAMGVHHITNEEVEDKPAFKGSGMYDALNALLSACSIRRFLLADVRSDLLQFEPDGGLQHSHGPKSVRR